MKPGDAHSEAQQIARARAGDRQAFGALVLAHQGYLRRLLLRACLGDAARADDLAQEAFVRAWRALPGFRGEARFRTWLTRLAWSALATERRGPATEAYDESRADAASDFAPGSDWRLDLNRAMQQLSERERDALLMCFAADLSHAEAAEVLGWPLGTLKTQVLRARAKLRLQLKDWEPNA